MTIAVMRAGSAVEANKSTELVPEPGTGSTIGTVFRVSSAAVGTVAGASPVVGEWAAQCGLGRENSQRLENVPRNSVVHTLLLFLSRGQQLGQTDRT